jgi:chromosome segregation ATPase
MTQEEKIKDLEEKIAIMKVTDSALCADLEHWKKVAAGLKGHNGQLKTLNQELSCKLSQKADALAVANESIANYSSQLNKTHVTLSDYKAIVEWYDELPWWRKIFTWKLLPKKKE